MISILRSVLFHLLHFILHRCGSILPLEVAFIYDLFYDFQIGIRVGFGGFFDSGFVLPEDFPDCGVVGGIGEFALVVDVVPLQVFGGFNLYASLLVAAYGLLCFKYTEYTFLPY